MLGKEVDNVFVKDGLSAISSLSISNEFTPELELFQNVPNPVRDNTSISFYLPQDGNVTLRDIKLIRTRYHNII